MIDPDKTDDLAPTHRRVAKLLAREASAPLTAFTLVIFLIAIAVWAATLSECVLRQ
jgi:hypothetical protein